MNNFSEGSRIPVNTRTFQNDLSEIRTRNEALTALIHLGYLAYDADFKEAYIPNFEVKEILLVGINYDRETKQHECVIEKINE